MAKKPTKKQPEEKITIPSGEFLALGSESRDAIYNSSIIPVSLTTKYKLEELFAGEKIYELFKDCDTIFEMTELKSYVLTGIAQCFDSLIVDFEDHESFWENFQIIYHDMKRNPQEKTILSLSREIGINLFSKANCFAYLTWEDDSFKKGTIKEKAIRSFKDITIIKPDLFYPNIDMLGNTTWYIRIPYDVPTEKLPKEYKGFFGEQVTNSQTSDKLFAVDNSRLIHISMPKPSGRPFAIPFFMSLIRLLKYMELSDQAGYSVLDSFISFILHIAVGGSQLLPSKKIKAASETYIQAIVDVVRGKSKSKIIGTTDNVKMEFITLPTELLQQGGLPENLQKRLDVSLVKEFFRDDTILSSLAVLKFWEVNIQAPVQDFWMLLAREICERKNWSNVPTISFPTMHWQDSSIVHQQNLEEWDRGLMSGKDVLKGEGRSFNATMKQRKLEEEQYGDIFQGQQKRRNDGQTVADEKMKDGTKPRK